MWEKIQLLFDAYFQKLTNFVPSLLIALVVFLVGLYIANRLKNFTSK